MRRIGILLVPAIALFTAGIAPAQAEPQMLGVIQTASAVPLHCSGANCTAELTSICLHEERATATSGYPYTTYNRCYRQTRIGDKNLRGCLAEAHDRFVLDLNEKYWDAVKAGS